MRTILTLMFVIPNLIFSQQVRMEKIDLRNYEAQFKIETFQEKSKVTFAEKLSVSNTSGVEMRKNSVRQNNTAEKIGKFNHRRVKVGNDKLRFRSKKNNQHFFVLKNQDFKGKIFYDLQYNEDTTLIESIVFKTENNQPLSPELTSWATLIVMDNVYGRTERGFLSKEDSNYIYGVFIGTLLAVLIL